MSLKVYKQKRNFKKTSEPAGGRKTKGDPIFVVQEHHASHLHYDFRLEADGTLKSWAVPKGPSMEIGLRRLAVEVEDHPIDYATFSGDIPEGEYGAGHVEIWDKGTWQSEGGVREGLKKGHLDFTLKGKKLNGRFLLQRTKGTGRKAQWILIKRHDEDKVEAKKKKATALVTPRQKGEEDPWPKEHQVELATLVDSPPEGAEWIHEVKFDGYRTLTSVRKGKIQMKTRKGLDWTKKYAPLDEEIKKIGVESAIFDGEIVALDETGASNFSMLQTALSNDEKDLVYYIFDLLYVNGHDLREEPLKRRKEILKKILGKQKSKSIRYSEHVRAQGAEFLANACTHKLEGIVSKLLASKYQSGRGDDWLKSKCLQRQEFAIGGYTRPQGSRKGLGALLVGYYEGKTFHYAGRVGTGFDSETLLKMEKTLSKVEASKSPFDIASPRATDGTNWVKPKYVAEISFGSWTDDKILRHATFQGWREDKGAKDVKLETAKPMKALQKKKTSKGASITHPERVVYPKANFTKLDIANYYASVAPWMLKHMADRPLSIVRCQNQTGEMCFFQKHVDAGSAEHIESTTIDDQDVNYVNTPAGLLDLVQLGTVEFHCWECHVDNGKPDQIVFDIDPDEKLPFSKVKETAFRIKEMLEQLDLESFVKTTGGKGLHVHVPIAAKYDWDRVKEFSLSVCEQLRSEYPDEYTTKSTKTRRTGKIYLDYLRNGFGATAIAPYSLRSKQQPVVSVPISWIELKKMTKRPTFDAGSTLKRLAKQKIDPWAKYPKLKQKIKILESQRSGNKR